MDNGTHSFCIGTNSDWIGTRIAAGGLSYKVIPSQKVIERVDDHIDILVVDITTLGGLCSATLLHTGGWDIPIIGVTCTEYTQLGEFERHRNRFRNEHGADLVRYSDEEGLLSSINVTARLRKILFFLDRTFCIDFNQRTVFYQKKKLKLGRSEILIVWHLASFMNRICPHDELLKYVAYGNQKTLNVHLSRIREKLKGLVGPDFSPIKTIRREGYLFTL